MAVSVYFLAFYVLGASFGPMLMGALSDHYAHIAMLAAGANETAIEFRALGLHDAMYVIPALVLMRSGALSCASSTVAKDMRRREGITEIGLTRGLQQT